MFKKIQLRLLLSNPLLWNIKILPVLFAMGIINLIYFLIGYLAFPIDFKETSNTHNFIEEWPIYLSSVVISMVFLILWLVFYFKNNPFKAFYPISKSHLFKEWILSFFILFSITSTIFWYTYGKDVRMRQYFSYEDLKKRCEILRAGSFFVEGSYNYHSREDDDYVVEVDSAATVEGTVDSLANCNCFYFRGKKYNDISLLNKNLNSYSIFNFESDSITTLKIQNWLVDQKKDSIVGIMRNYLAIAKEHDLKTNLTAEEWYALIDDYPLYENSKSIGPKHEIDEMYNGKYNPRTGEQFDSINRYIARNSRGTKFEFYKYYVPEDQLSYNYSKLANAHEIPDANFKTLLIPLYVALFLSLFIFSFRVTSGRTWLIALIGLTLINIVFAIGNAFVPNGADNYVYPAALLLLASLLFILLQTKIAKGYQKGYSGVYLTVVLWMLPILFMLVVGITKQILKDIAYALPMDYYKTPQWPYIEWIEDNIEILAMINFGVILILLYFLSHSIRKWRGLPEE